MAHEISVTLRADPKPYEQAVERLRSATDEWEKSTAAGADDVSERFEEVIRALIDMERQGGRSSDDIERSLRALGFSAEDAEDAIAAVDRELRNAGESVDELPDKADNVGDSMRDLGEIASSVLEGDFAGAASSAITSLAGLATFAGAGGALAGTLAQGVTSMVTGWIDEWDRANEESKKRAAEWAQAYIDAGDTILSAGVLAARFQAIITDSERFAEAERNAKNWGVSIETAVAAMSGNRGAIDDVNVSLREQRDAAAEAATEAQRLAQENGGQLLTLTEQEKAYQAGADALARLTGEMTQGERRAALLTGYYLNLINTTQGVTKEVDEFGNELYSLPDGTQVMIDAETGQATQNVDNFKGDLDGIPENVTTTVTARVSFDDRAFWDHIGVIQRRAAQGVQVNVRAGQGRAVI